VSLEFEWDTRKASSNLKKHGVSFQEASTVFSDPLSATVHDPDHSDVEDRLLTVGVSKSRRILVVAHTERDNRIRIISARELTSFEKRQYEEQY
jgi:uncharacterized DUF497 family protein